MAEALKRIDPDPPVRFADEEPPHAETVGELLRRTRREYGEELSPIAAQLRLRESYLEAIESGRFDALPGPTYAVGFVRSYADYLDLDGARVVERFKAEVRGLGEQQNLSFPTPLPESRLPGRTVIFVAAVLALLAYAGWYLYSSDDEGMTSFVEEVPEDLRDVVETGPQSGSPESPFGEDGVTSQQTQSQSLPGASGPDAAEPELSERERAAGDSMGGESGNRGTTQGTTQDTTSPATGESERGQAADAPAEAAETAPATALPEAPPELGELPDIPSPPSAPTESRESAPSSAAMEDAGPTAQLERGQSERGQSEPGTAAIAGATGIAEAQGIAEATGEATGTDNDATETADTTGTPSSTPGQEDEAAIPEPPALGTTSGEAASRTAQVFGESNENARIQLVARQDSWVQVRDGSGALLLTRVLRPGDKYLVPNRENLTLLTGNAGGLSITVDGKEIPRLGPVGSVRRDVSLDPEQLLSLPRQER